MNNITTINVAGRMVDKSQRTLEVENAAREIRDRRGGDRHRAMLKYLNEHFQDTREWLVAEKIFNEVFQYTHNCSFNL